MTEQTWKRKEYETWDDAFQGLAPSVRQQSVRVAGYTRVIFVQACLSGFGAGLPQGKEQITAKYADVAYKCGMYHQLGKALVPAEYQIWQKDFTEEESAVYKKYTVDGRQLVASLQERASRSLFKREKKHNSGHTDNITWLMLRESCEQHMERYDGSGYPNGLIADQISPIAQIVGLAKELDRLSSETKSENPFAEAFDTLVSQSGKAFSPELIEVLKASRAKCRTVYNKFIHYTLALPKTIPLLEKRKERPIGLSYRPIINGDGAVTAYEANMWFAGIAGNAGGIETAADVEEVLKRTGIVTDISVYFLYEAADTLLRIQNCKLALDFIVLNMLPSFYKSGSQLQKFNQLFKDQPIDKNKFLLTIPQSVLLEANKSTAEVIERYLKNGINLVLDDWNPSALSADKLSEYGFKYVRTNAEIFKSTDNAKLLSRLNAQGLTVISGNTDDTQVLDILSAYGIKYITGTLSGAVVDEENLIRDSLLRER